MRSFQWGFCRRTTRGLQAVCKGSTNLHSDLYKVHSRQSGQVSKTYACADLKIPVCFVREYFHLPAVKTTPLPVVQFPVEEKQHRMQSSRCQNSSSHRMLGSHLKNFWRIKNVFSLFLKENMLKPRLCSQEQALTIVETAYYVTHCIIVLLHCLLIL